MFFSKNNKTEFVNVIFRKISIKTRRSRKLNSLLRFKATSKIEKILIRLILLVA